ncbi:gamma-glutamyl kinase [Pseudoroseicyclus tamaricis]|uniref:Gamma-glutamyl kinase n=1 Tax=Pseudoroseicyclus tamaricis TaxID=2705421 RepID=A0A6B2JRU4_9RHOB|nr:gamma-glutamyl kinase [Pseudoroseicyclus tamaricis]NDV00705.1 gamma-glutamyl kinase [Pseudoroseicyclus tamaricis]
MMVFTGAGLAILAVPKTGTTALEAALGPRADMLLRNPPRLKHMTLYRYRRRILPLLKVSDIPPPETVAVIREPLSCLGSWYRYRQPPERPNSTAGMSFDDFVDAWCREKRPPPADVGTQWDMVNDGEDVAVDHLFRYDEMDRLHAFLEERLGQRIEVPPANVSPRMDLSLKAGMVARLKKKGARELALWERLGGEPAV